jgi:succinoglycan biosynthesis protein ExoA
MTDISAVRILAIIPCLNEELYLEALVRKLVRDCEALAMRIVIADGGSQDRTPDIARKLAEEYSNVVYLHNPRRLQSAAVNLAVATYGDEADLLIRLDAHSDYPEHYCQTLIEEQLASGAASVVVAMDTVGTGVFQHAVAVAQNSKLGNGGSSHRTVGGAGQWVDHGHHALMRIDAFREVGGYDENFSHNEDAELDIRLTQAGYKIWLTGKTALTYYPRSSPIPLFRQYYNFGKGRARTILKHRIMPRVRQMVPTAVAPAILLALLTPVFCIAAVPLVLWAALCLGYGVALGIKKRSSSVAILTGIAAMLMHAGWSFGFWKEILKT